MFGVIYIILGNLSGNAVAFGIYFCQMVGLTKIPGDQMAVLDGSDDRRHDPLVRGLAVLCLTIACLIHALWRKGGIWLINGLAIIKTLIIVAIIVIGFAVSGGASFGHGKVHGQTFNPSTDHLTSNFSPAVSFTSARGDAAGYASAILFASYCFSGYEQPFYVGATLPLCLLSRKPADLNCTGPGRSLPTEEVLRNNDNSHPVICRRALHACQHSLCE